MDDFDFEEELERELQAAEEETTGRDMAQHAWCLTNRGVATSQR